MTSERRARDTYDEVQRLNMAVQSLAESALLGLPVTYDDVFDLLQKTRMVSYHACRALDSAHRDAGRRSDDKRLPPFDGVDDAQRAAAQAVPAVTATDVAESIGAAVRRALVREGQS